MLSNSSSSNYSFTAHSSLLNTNLLASAVLNPNASSFTPKTNKAVMQWKVFNNEEIHQNLIKAQIEYLFSDLHLVNDRYLFCRMTSENSEHWISVDDILFHQKIGCLTADKKRVIQAMEDSKYLELSEDKKRVRRPNMHLPQSKPNRDLRRTVFLYGMLNNRTTQEICDIFQEYGHIKRIHFENDSKDDECPQRMISLLIMKKKFCFPAQIRLDEMNINVNMNDLLHLTSCFLVYESQSQATKCVKARGRAVDGMRCMHRYDYNKVAKKVKNAQMRGETISFTSANYYSYRNARTMNDYQLSRTPNFDPMGMYANDMRISFALNKRQNGIQSSRVPISLTPNFSSYARDCKQRGIPMDNEMRVNDGQLIPPKLYYYPPPGMSSVDMYDDPLFGNMNINQITHSAPFGPLTAPDTEVKEKDIFSITREVLSNKGKSESKQSTVLSVLSCD